MPLVPIWEVWNWTDADVDFFGVLFLLFGAFGAGYAVAIGRDRPAPKWLIVVVIFGVIGLFLLISDMPPCEPGDC